MSFIHKVKYAFTKNRPSDAKVGSLTSSFDMNLSLYKIKTHRWELKQIVNYLLMSTVISFVLVTNPASILAKIIVVLIFAILCLLPITGQFFFNALPIFTWLSLYFTSSTFSASSRFPISVNILPAVETILYGDDLSAILSNSQNMALDILAWIPYGLFHFGAPFVVAIILFLFGPPKILRSYAFAFGYMNLFGVIIQNLYPAAPPWYNDLYPDSIPNYSMKGSPGGLARIDKLLGINLYTSGFSNSSVIFGAFPSLHSGCATMEALFFSYTFPQLRPIFVLYVFWLWWSTMYLTHHYFIDLVAGAMLSFSVFEYTKYNYYMPKILPDGKFHSRWSYGDIDYMHYNDCNPFAENPLDLESSAIQLNSYSKANTVPITNTHESNSNELEFDLDDLELTTKQEEENKQRYNFAIDTEEDSNKSKKKNNSNNNKNKRK
ncbi:PAP2-domain-containing protein [Hanseniaspora valbyensis NRRL Y-1626]|uniref:PAP2-domain-containing protein n=1 Tax=Hanseniaspora valbyensis NRRL Y-1626 TaxID=766949 RepID=A0A1B7TDS5_9ASCO|nr:PAP2-domain-containing protein [Hanseniaspora valbyensis NRRL Y-1626]